MSPPAAVGAAAAALEPAAADAADSAGCAAARSPPEDSSRDPPAAAPAAAAPAADSPPAAAGPAAAEERGDSSPKSTEDAPADGSPAPTLPEVQVYHFDADSNQWIDQGAGYAGVVIGGADADPASPEAQRHIRVQQAGGVVLLSEPIRTDANYVIEVGTGITFWSEADRCEKALSFDDSEVCAAFWNTVVAAQLRQGSGVQLPGPEDLRSTARLEQAAAAIVTASAAAAPLLADWWHNVAPLPLLFTLLTELAKADPGLSRKATRRAVRQVYRITHAAATAAPHAITEDITGEPAAWLHYLLLCDLAQHAGLEGAVEEGEEPQEGADSGSQGGAVEVGAEVDGIPEPPTTAAPWRLPAETYKHLRQFLGEAEGAALPSLRRFGALKNPHIDEAILQAYRCEYWVRCVILPMDSRCHPIPSAQPFSVAGAGEWEGVVSSLRVLQQELQVRVSVELSKEDDFLNGLVAALEGSNPQVPAREAWRLLEELLDCGHAALQRHQVDWAEELAPRGLLRALAGCLRRGPEEELLPACRLLERLTGGQPKAGTSGKLLRLALSGGGGADGRPEAAEVLAAAAELTVSSEARCLGAQPHLFECCQRLLFGAGGAAAARPRADAQPAAPEQLADAVPPPASEPRDAAPASPAEVEGACDAAADAGGYEAAAALCTCDTVLPVWAAHLERCAGAPPPTALEEEQALRIVEVLGVVLDRDGVEVGPAERALHSQTRARVAAEVVARGMLAPRCGALALRLRAAVSRPVRAVPIARVYRCVVQAADDVVAEHLVSSQALSAVAAALADCRRRGGPWRSGMLASSLLSVFEAVAAHPVELMHSAARALVASEEWAELLAAGGDQECAVRALGRYAADPRALDEERREHRQRLQGIADASAARELMEMLGSCTAPAGEGLQGLAEPPEEGEGCDEAFIEEEDDAPEPPAAPSAGSSPDAVQEAAPPAAPAPQQPAPAATAPVEQDTPDTREPAPAAAAAVEQEKPRLQRSIEPHAEIQADAEVRWAYEALMDIEELRVRLHADYLAACAKAGQEPCPPRLRMPEAAAALAPAERDLLHTRLAALRDVQAAAAPGAPPLSPSPPAGRPQPTRSPVRRDARAAAAVHCGDAAAPAPAGAPRPRRRDSLESLHIAQRPAGDGPAPAPVQVVPLGSLPQLPQQPQPPSRRSTGGSAPRAPTGPAAEGPPAAPPAAAAGAAPAPAPAPAPAAAPRAASAEDGGTRAAWNPQVKTDMRSPAALPMGDPARVRAERMASVYAQRALPRRHGARAGGGGGGVSAVAAGGVRGVAAVGHVRERAPAPEEAAAATAAAAAALLTHGAPATRGEQPVARPQKGPQGSSAQGDAPAAEVVPAARRGEPPEGARHAADSGSAGGRHALRPRRRSSTGSGGERRSHGEDGSRSQPRRSTRLKGLAVRGGAPRAAVAQDEARSE